MTTIPSFFCFPPGREVSWKPSSGSVFEMRIPGEKANRKREQLSYDRMSSLGLPTHMTLIESMEVLSWLSQKGEATLKRHAQLASDLRAFKRQEQEFEKFYFISMSTRR
ncbi:hypothetical protein J437_LFUL010757 [Ladona fulva]|uniref:Uncharacterized protein n=1 Tax=Ladona fulva TaxID=123851 RepID=A0A8K0K958_LADFU|nr:hypothetical protein J437_LFUL010757 [Ladona fulva]